MIKDGKYFVAEEIGTMNGTFLNGKKLPNGVLTPIHDGDELVLCRLVLQLQDPPSRTRLNLGLAGRRYQARLALALLQCQRCFEPSDHPRSDQEALQ